MADRPYLGLRKPVPPPPATAPLHGLIASTRDVTDHGDARWEGGFGFVPETCMQVYAWSPACAASGAGEPPVKGGKTITEGADGIEVLPFTLYAAFRCTTAGMVSRDDEGRVRRALEAGTSKGLEEEFWSDSLGLGNFSLVGSTPNVASVDGAGGILNPTLGTAVKPRLALALLNQGRADCALGSRGVIHAPTILVALWAAAGALEKDGQKLVTRVRGDIVVAGSGYPGTGPTGTAPPAGTVWAYGTGMVETRSSEITIVPDQLAWALDRSLNRVAYLAERTVAADTDGCCPHAVLVDVSTDSE